MEKAPVPRLLEQFLKVARQQDHLDRVVLECRRQWRPLLLRFPPGSCRRRRRLGGGFICHLFDPVLSSQPVEGGGVGEHMLLGPLRRQVQLFAALQLPDEIGHVELGDVRFRMAVLRPADLEQARPVDRVRRDTERVVRGIDEVAPITAHLNRCALGAVLRLGVGRQCSVRRVVTREARFERDACEAERLVMEPVHDAGFVFDVRVVVPVHHVFPVIISLTVISPGSLVPQRLDVEWNIRSPPFEHILEDVSVLELKALEIDHIRQGMVRIVRHHLDELFGYVGNIAAVLLADEGVPVQAQEEFHALACGQSPVVDHLQEKHVPGQNFVVCLVQEEAQARSLAPAAPPRRRLQHMPDVRAAGHEDVHGALLRQRRWLGGCFLLFARIDLLPVPECRVRLPVFVLVLLARRHTLGGDAERRCLAIPHQVQSRGIPPELDEADRV
mmetsp:Transcript_57723/g.167212  ORF Transcript_57723/g.167212 Transcript_57723/m.167212 type:complete len:443 (+) Transcript_57723:481-1809(+)